MLKLIKTGTTEVQQPRLTKPQFYRMLDSIKGSFEVCNEFYKDSTMLPDKKKVADIAEKVRWFAKGRVGESKVQKFFIGQYAVLSGVATALGIIVNPYYLLLLIPHTLMSTGIFFIGSQNRPYASRFAPLLNSEQKIIKEVQAYLEYREFTEYKVSLDNKPLPVVTDMYRYGDWKR